MNPINQFGLGHGMNLMDSRKYYVPPGTVLVFFGEGIPEGYREATEEETKRCLYPRWDEGKWVVKV